VDDLIVMQVVHSACYLLSPVHHLSRFEQSFLFVQVAEQLTIRAELHYDTKEFVAIERDAFELDQVRVIELAQIANVSFLF